MYKSRYITTTTYYELQLAVFRIVTRFSVRIVWLEVEGIARKEVGRDSFRMNRFKKPMPDSLDFNYSNRGPG